MTPPSLSTLLVVIVAVGLCVGVASCRDRDLATRGPIGEGASAATAR
jgi:hypothetical protein